MIGQGRGRTFKFKIDEVVAKLKENRAEHDEIVEEARVKFREMAIEKLKEALRLAEQDKGEIRTSINLTVPRSYTEEYDNAIELLEATQRAGEEIVELDSDEFQRFMRNKWHWVQDFSASNARYSAKAATYGS